MKEYIVSYIPLGEIMELIQKYDKEKATAIKEENLERVQILDVFIKDLIKLECKTGVLR